MQHWVYYTRYWFMNSHVLSMLCLMHVYYTRESHSCTIAVSLQYVLVELRRCDVKCVVHVMAFHNGVLPSSPCHLNDHRVIRSCVVRCESPSS
jgi:hypothetical protein